jgi:hypothetical protein
VPIDHHDQMRKSANEPHNSAPYDPPGAPAQVLIKHHSDDDGCHHLQAYLCQGKVVTHFSRTVRVVDNSAPSSAGPKIFRESRKRRYFQTRLVKVNDFWAIPWDFVRVGLNCEKTERFFGLSPARETRLLQAAGLFLLLTAAWKSLYHPGTASLPRSVWSETANLDSGKGYTGEYLPRTEFQRDYPPAASAGRILSYILRRGGVPLPGVVRA